MSQTVCDECGAFGQIAHAWVEGDCVLPHRTHSRNLELGTNVCKACIRRWDDWLTEIVELYSTLGTVLRTGSIPDTTAEHAHAKITGSPALFRLAPWALLHPEGLNSHTFNDDGELEHVGMSGLPDIADVLHNHAQAVLDSNGWTGDAPDTVTGAVGAIKPYLTTIAALPDVDTFDAELRWVRRALRNAHGISDPKPLFACITVDCGGNVWQQTAGSPKCERCGRRYGTLDYVRAKAMQDRETAWATTMTSSPHPHRHSTRPSGK